MKDDEQGGERDRQAEDRVSEKLETFVRFIPAVLGAPRAMGERMFEKRRVGKGMAELVGQLLDVGSRSQEFSRRST